MIKPESSFRYKVSSRFGKGLIRLLEILVSLFTKKVSVFSNSDFSWVSEIENNFPLIYKEYEKANRSSEIPDICDISEEQYKVIARNQWRFLPLFVYGIPIKENIDRCPQTARVLEAIPNKTTVFFSILQPGSYVKPHRGAYKGYLRYHLGVEIPEPNDSCGLKIENRVYHWENGKSLIFDDTYVHEAWNNSKDERVVLYVDFIRPMPRFMIDISWRLTRLISRSPFVQNTIEKLKTHNYDKQTSVLLG